MHTKPNSCIACKYTPSGCVDQKYETHKLYMLKFSIRLKTAKSEGPWSCSLQYRHHMWKRDIAVGANACCLFSFARRATSNSGKCEAGQICYKVKIEHFRNELISYMRKVLTRIFLTKLDKITELTCGTHRRVMRRVSTRILREAADNPHRKLVMEMIQISKRSYPEMQHKRSSQRARTDLYVANIGVKHALGSENGNLRCRTSARAPET